MANTSLSPPRLIADEEGLAALVAELASAPAVAVDTESNSLHAYRERVCLIQFTTPRADFILDPLALHDLRPLAPIFASPLQQKVFHAAEYDLLCLKRDYQFEVRNIFDTMIAARTLGWAHVGLAAILEREFEVTTNKKYQRADWKRRPLSHEQLDYARLDTHFLLALRDRQLDALTAIGGLDEAGEEFERLAQLAPPPAPSGPPAFWRVNGARDLAPAQAAILQAVFAFREQQAERLDRPPFKVMGDATLLAIVRRAPQDQAALAGVPGMTPDQIRRYSPGLLAAVQHGLHAEPLRAPVPDSEPDAVRDRYDRLHKWRKEKARARGVESDVILPRTALWDLARRVPRTDRELAHVADVGPWRRGMYGAEILALLAVGNEPVND